MNISCCSDFAPCSHEKPEWVVPWVVSYDFAWRTYGSEYSVLVLDLERRSRIREI